MKTELAVLIALSVALGELTTSAAVIALSANTGAYPVNAAFGGGLVDDNANASETAFVGVAPATASDLYTPFSPNNSAMDGFDLNLAATYYFRLRYVASSTVTFSIFTDAARTTAVTWLSGPPTETDLYNDPALSAGAKQNINTLTGIYLRLFSAVDTAAIKVSGLAFSSAGDAFTSAPNADGYLFTGTVSSSLSETVFLPATGLSDGFTLDGIFNFSGDTSNGGSKRNVGFAVFAAVPEPATVAFGLAMVGGLGLLEIRRRKNS